MQRWKLPFFFTFSVAFVLVLLHFFAFFVFFRKKMQKLTQVAKKCNGENAASQVTKKCNGENATLEVAFFLLFPFRYFWHLHFPLHF